METFADRGRLLISCPDRPGIVALVTRFLFEQGANVVDSQQHSTHPSEGLFFMRLEFDLPGLGQRLTALERDFNAVTAALRMTFQFSWVERLKRVALFVSREEHCLLELLWRWKAGDLRADLACVVSNHPNAQDVAKLHELPFFHVPVTADTKLKAEQEVLSKLPPDIDLLVLARYMQVLSPAFVAKFPHRIINIHHSFLPAFSGAKPYAQALERGVKLIGATAHYVTEALDAGPIIEQDVMRVDHRAEVVDLQRVGRQVERAVLARAVGWHVEDRVLVHGNRTVVFS
ncbi:MAG: formyltetrahydrofolate deformylase [Myxococcaceae bacterium]